jgi:CspA family cold shock protein
MLTGKIVQFDDMRGYGFIAPDKGGEDVFVHANVLGDEKHIFCPGLPVEFEVTEGDRGLKAHAVRIVTRTAQGPTGALLNPAPRPVPPAAPVAPAPPVNADSPDVSADSPDEGEELCDVLTASAFSHELTELLLDSEPAMTAGQIKLVRNELIELGKRHGWVDC